MRSSPTLRLSSVAILTLSRIIRLELKLLVTQGPRQTVALLSGVILQGLQYYLSEANDESQTSLKLTVLTIQLFYKLTSLISVSTFYAGQFELDFVL